MLYVQRDAATIVPGDVIAPKVGVGHLVRQVTITETEVELLTDQGKSYRYSTDDIVETLIDGWPMVDGPIIIRRGRTASGLFIADQLAVAVAVDCRDEYIYQLTAYPHILLSPTGGDRIYDFDRAVALPKNEFDTITKDIQVSGVVR